MKRKSPAQKYAGVDGLLLFQLADQTPGDVHKAERLAIVGANEFRDAPRPVRLGMTELDDQPRRMVDLQIQPGLPGCAERGADRELEAVERSLRQVLFLGGMWDSHRLGQVGY